jgi:hypothetical protein
MSLFDLFGKKEDKAAAHTAPGTSIHFDPHLIERLTGDHRRLLEIYKHVQAALGKGDFVAVKRQLGDFRTALQEHLLTENVKFYVYVSRQLASDESSSKIISDFRSEMQHIGRVVMDFLRKYTEGPLDAASADSFRAEFEQIGAALGQRIQREEGTLYPLYLPAY